MAPRHWGLRARQIYRMPQDLYKLTGLKLSLICPVNQKKSRKSIQLSCDPDVQAFKQRPALNSKIFLKRGAVHSLRGPVHSQPIDMIILFCLDYNENSAFFSCSFLHTHLAIYS